MPLAVCPGRNTGIELGKNGDLTGVLDHYDQAEKTDVTNVVFQRNAALFPVQLGRPRKAIRRLRDIFSLDSDDAGDATYPRRRK